MNKHQSKLIFNKSNACIYFWLPDNREPSDMLHMHTWLHHDLWIAVLNLLIRNGIRITADPDVLKRSKLISPYHKYGNWKGLEFSVEISQACFSFTFFQNINPGDRKPGDGKYTLKKYEIMPYIIKKRFEYVARLIISYVLANTTDCDYSCSDRPVLAEHAVIQLKQGSWHNRKPPVNSLEDFQAQMCDYDLSQNNNDRDKKKINCGDLKYFYDNGHISRGRVYHSLNNSWFVIINKFYLRTIASCYLFDPTPADLQLRRKKEARLPEHRKKEIDLLNSIPLGRLKKVIKRRSKQPV